MTKSIFKDAIAATAIFAGLAFTLPDIANAASCSNSMSTCVNRCKTKYASDKNCVSDHCTPKFASCKSSGCWQQGGDFGNVLTCNLDKK